MEGLILSTPEQLRALFRDEIARFFREQPLPNAQPETGKQILDLDEFCQYARIGKQTAYKLTSTNRVPHSKRGKRLFFDKAQIDAWLLENRAAYVSEAAINQQVNDYLDNPKKRRRA